MQKILPTALALILALWALPLWAQSETLSVEGHVAHPLKLTLEQVKALPPVTVSLTFQSDHGPQTGTYTGALLLDIVNQAAPMDRAATWARRGGIPSSPPAMTDMAWLSRSAKSIPVLPASR